jgi:hypothetical protein
MKPRSRFLPALLASFVALLLAIFVPVPAPAQAYVGKPKLIVIVVIDQFRGDYLNRDHAEFKGHGFRLFTDEGAWFTDCYFDYANTKTAPGHATIGTGAYTDGHGIETNEWWDASRSFDHKVSSVEDERYQLVDLPAASIPANQPGAPDTALKYVIGASPRNLRATTVGDELRLATNGRSRVYGISLKDRAAILPAGQAANAAYWIDNCERPLHHLYLLHGAPAGVGAGLQRQRPRRTGRTRGQGGGHHAVLQTGGRKPGSQPLRAGLCQGAHHRRKTGPERRDRPAGGFAFRQRYSRAISTVPTRTQRSR